jgi:hypothetical protein
MRILTSAVLDGYARRKDKSVSLRFVTGEKSSLEIASIDQMCEQFGYLYFKAEETLTPNEVKELDTVDTDLFDNPRTQSQRLRGVLFKVWEQGGRHGEFKDFYKSETERIITHYKTKLQ